MSPDFDGGDYCEEFLVMYLIVALGRDHLARHKCDGEKYFAVVLRQNRGNGVVGGVGLDDSG